MAKLTIFTDGSSIGNPGPGGWAWKCQETGKFQYGSYPGSWTAPQMELTAVLEALGSCMDGDQVEIVSDNQICLQMLAGSARARQKHIADLVSAVRILAGAKRLELTFRRVEGHKGDLLNNQVDALARQAARRAAKMDVRMSEDQPDGQAGPAKSAGPEIYVDLELRIHLMDQDSLRMLMAGLDRYGCVANGQAVLNSKRGMRVIQVKDNQING